jgi:hypothetical protein
LVNVTNNSVGPLLNFGKYLGKIYTLNTQEENNQPRKKPNGSNKGCIATRGGSNQEIAQKEVGYINQSRDRDEQSRIERINER